MDLKQEIARMMKRMDEPFEPQPFVISQMTYDAFKKQGFDMRYYVVQKNA